MLGRALRLVLREILDPPGLFKTQKADNARKGIKTIYVSLNEKLPSNGSQKADNARKGIKTALSSVAHRPPVRSTPQKADNARKGIKTYYT